MTNEENSNAEGGHNVMYGICENKCFVPVSPKTDTDAVKDRVGALEPKVSTLESEMDQVQSKNTEQDTIIANNNVNSIILSVDSGVLTAEVGKVGGGKVSDTVELPSGGTITKVNIPSFYQFATASEQSVKYNADWYKIETKKEPIFYIKDGSLIGGIIDVTTTKVNTIRLQNPYMCLFEEIIFSTDKVQTMMETILESYDNVSCEVEMCLAFTGGNIDEYGNANRYGGETLNSYKITCKKTNGVVSNISSDLPTSNIGSSISYVYADQYYSFGGLLIKSLLIY